MRPADPGRSPEPTGSPRPGRPWSPAAAPEPRRPPRTARTAGRTRRGAAGAASPGCGSRRCPRPWRRRSPPLTAGRTSPRHAPPGLRDQRGRPGARRRGSRPRTSTVMSRAAPDDSGRVSRPDARGPCGDAQRGSHGRRASACADGIHGCGCDAGCSAGKCACSRQSPLFGSCSFGCAHADTGVAMTATCKRYAVTAMRSKPDAAASLVEATRRTYPRLCSWVCLARSQTVAFSPTTGRHPHLE